MNKPPKSGLAFDAYFEHPTFQGATAPTCGDPGCRFACLGLRASLGLQPALAKIIVAISMLVVERLC